MPEPQIRFPKLLLQQYLLDELPPQKMQEIRQAMESSPALTAELEAMKSFNQSFNEKFEFTELGEKTKYTYRKTFSHIQSLAVAASFSFVALILFITMPTNRNSMGDNIHVNGDIVRLKGLQPELHIYNKKKNAINELHNNATAYQNDLLQLSYVAAGAGYGAIFSIDGNGSLTLHYPENINKANKLETSGEVHLKFSYALDDAPDFERFFFVTSSTPFDINVLLSKAQQLTEHRATSKTATLSLDDTLQQTSITIQKGSL